MPGTRLFFTAALLIALSAPRTLAADSASSSKELDAIRAAAKAYVSALEQGKVEAVAAAWTPDGDYVDASGHSFKARNLIAAEFRKGAGGHRDLKVTIDSVRLITPEVAVEDGHIQHTRRARRVAAARPIHGRVGQAQFALAAR